MKSKASLLLLVITLIALEGCTTLAYYGQAVGGQVNIITRARPIDRILSDPKTPKPLAEQLQLVEDLMNFATETMSLPDNGSYRKYADIGRPYVVWNVFAAAEFSTEPETWCFPVAGCLGYRGYFAEQRALEFAEQLVDSGLEVFVTGIDAYSTLGRFRDPVLNTFVDYHPEDLAGLLFHELTHQHIYVKDDFVFNESLASAVESGGVRIWAESLGDPEIWTRYQQRSEFRRNIVNEMLTARDRLQLLYESAGDPAEQRLGKRQILHELKRTLRKLSIDNGRNAGWIEELEFNNAMLSSYGTYFDYEPAFSRILEESGHDFREFFKQVQHLADLPVDIRREWFEERLN